MERSSIASPLERFKTQRSSPMGVKLSDFILELDPGWVYRVSLDGSWYQAGRTAAAGGHMRRVSGPAALE